MFYRHPYAPHSSLDYPNIKMSKMEIGFLSSSRLDLVLNFEVQCAFHLGRGGTRLKETRNLK